MINLKYIILLVSILYAVMPACGQDMRKMSPYVRKVARDYRQALSRRQASAHGHTADSGPQCDRLTALVRISDSDAVSHDTDARSLLIRHGCRIMAQWGDIYAAAIPLTQLGPLSQHAVVQRIEAGQAMSVTLDTTTVITHANDVWRYDYSHVYEPSSAHTDNTGHTVVAGQTWRSDHISHTGLTGRGVVVGVMDIGFDLNHPLLMTRDGSQCRVRRLWDQLDLTDQGHAVVIDDSTHVGRQYITADELRTKDHACDAAISGHGTHTATTAAGSGYDGTSQLTPYVGMAYDADLCLVANYTSNNKALIPEDRLPLYNNVTDLLGFKYIMDYAQSVGRPCVINFSEGSYDDFFENQLYAEVFNNHLIGPGRIICASAGNESLYLRHAEKPVGTPRAGGFVNMPNNYLYTMMHAARPPEIELTFYLNDGSHQRFIIDTSAYTPGDEVTDTLTLTDNSEWQMIIHTDRFTYDADRWAAEMLIQGTADGQKLDGTVSLAVLDPDNDVSVNLYGSTFEFNSLDATLYHYTSDHNILFPGTVSRVVTVGATGHRTSVVTCNGEWLDFNYGANGERCSFSSVGPTASGLTKPDITAPGQNIIAGYSSQMLEAQPDHYDCTRLMHVTQVNGRRYPWVAISGTSMSCPVVTGIIAQWLEACPTLTPEQVKEIFSATAIHRKTTLSYPNNEYGHGDINALAGLKYIEQHITGIQNITSDDTSDHSALPMYDLMGRRVTTPQPGTIVIRGGKKMIWR